MSDGQRVEALRQRGYKIDGAYADAQGRLFTIVSGQGWQRCAILQSELLELADGRVSLQELVAQAPARDTLGPVPGLTPRGFRTDPSRT